MKIKRIIGLGAIALAAITFVSCGDSGEKEAPNTIKYMNAAGQEEEVVINKTNDLAQTKDAALVIKAAAEANEEFKSLKSSYTSVSLDGSTKAEVGTSVTYGAVNAKVTMTTKQNSDYLINFEQKKVKVDTNATVKVKEKVSVQGYSESYTSKAKSSGTTYSQFYENNVVSILDGKISSNGQSRVLKYYTDKNIKFENYENYDFYNLDRLYDYMLVNGDLVSITSTTKSSVTFEFKYAYDKNYISTVMGDDTQTQEMIEYGLFDNFFNNIFVKLTINTKTYLPTKIYMKAACANLNAKDFFNSTMTSYSINNAFLDLNTESTYKLKYGNETIDKVVDKTGYTEQN